MLKVNLMMGLNIVAILASKQGHRIFYVHKYKGKIVILQAIGII